MKILYVSNSSVQRCGVAEFGRQNLRALRALGHSVHDWDGDYPVARTHGYFPLDWADYDILHLNWQPSTLNHYVPEVIPPHPRISIFLHDIPPHSTCSAFSRAHLLFSFEPSPDFYSVVIPPPMIEHRPQVPMSPTPLVGRTGITTDGLVELEEVCRRRGWELSQPWPIWVSLEEELDRLAQSWVNVVWYREQRSRSTAAMACCAARRPVLLSRSARFTHLRPWADTLYWADYPDGLESALERVIHEVAEGRAKLPSEELIQEFSWRRACLKMVAAWQELL